MFFIGLIIQSFHRKKNISSPIIIFFPLLELIYVKDSFSYDYYITNASERTFYAAGSTTIDLVSLK
jgi:hypothetical protein